MLHLLLATARAAAGDVLFAEDWTGGTGAWRTVGDPVVLVEAPDDAGTSRLWQHETIRASGGRVFTATPLPVVGGTRYCLSARIHQTAGAVAFLGLDITDAAGVPSVEHWLIGGSAQGNGYGGSVTLVPDDPDARAPHTAEFVVEADATHVVLKDELWINGAAGAADFADLRLVEGPCGAGPGDDPDDPDEPDEPDANTGNVTPTLLPPEGGGCAQVPVRPGVAVLLVSLLARRRRAGRP